MNHRRHIPRSPRDVGQRGSVMILAVTILAALLAGGGMMLYLQISSTKAAGTVQTGRRAMFCAEAGIMRGRALIASNFTIWDDLIDQDIKNDPPWYPIQGDIDDPPDGVPDYVVTVEDNADETGPNNPNVDNDLRIRIVSRCTKYPGVAPEVIEMVTYQSASTGYRNQAGQGARNSGNIN